MNILDSCLQFVAISEEDFTLKLDTNILVNTVIQNLPPGVWPPLMLVSIILASFDHYFNIHLSLKNCITTALSFVLLLCQLPILKRFNCYFHLHSCSKICSKRCFVILFCSYVSSIFWQDLTTISIILSLKSHCVKMGWHKTKSSCQEKEPQNKHYHCLYNQWNEK